MASSYKTLCYALAIVHIIIYGSSLLLVTAGFSTIEKIVNKTFEEVVPPEEAAHLDYDTFSQVFTVVIVIVSVVFVLHILAAVACIIGIKKQRPHYIRRFRIYALVCLILGVLGLLAYINNPLFLLSQLPAVALFGAEFWAAGKCYDIMLEEIRQKGNNPAGVDYYPILA